MAIMGTQGMLTVSARENWQALLAQARSRTRVWLPAAFTVSFESSGEVETIEVPRGTEAYFFCNVRGNYTLPSVKPRDRIMCTFFGHDYQITIHKSGRVRVVTDAELRGDQACVMAGRS